MSDFIITSKPRNGALIADAEKAYKWSGVYPASCLPGIAPLAEGPRAQTMAQMARDFKRNKNGLIGLPSGSKALALLLHRGSLNDDTSSEQEKLFFDPDKFLVTRTKTVDLNEGRISIAHTVVIKSPFNFPLGMSTVDPNIVLVPDDSWALFSTGGEKVIAYRRAGLAVSIRQLNGGTFDNRELMELSSNDWASLLGRAAK
jgi:hypothetical protein